MLLILGGLLALLGLLLLLAGRVPYPSTGSGHRLGRLPGNLTLRRDGLTIYFPVVTWLALSPSTGSFDKLKRCPESIEGTASGHRLALTLLLNLAFRVLRR